MVTLRFAVGGQPLATLLRRTGDHVHALCVARRIGKIDDHLATQRVGLQSQQLAVSCRGLRRRSDLVEAFWQTLSEGPGLTHVFKEEHRRYAILIHIEASLDATGPRQGDHATLV
jgi:hypothetical protein